MTVDPEGSFAPPTTTVVERLRYRATHQADKRAFTYLADGEKEAIDLSYGELDRQARAIAAHLASLGMVGERALLLYPPGLEFIAAFFGCLYAGAVAVPAYPPRRNRNMLRIQTISDDAQAKVAMSEHSVMERVQGMLDEAPHLKQLEWVATDRLSLGKADEWSEPAIDGETLAFLQYTSGSTGAPKGVILTHTNLMHNSALIANAFETARGHEGCFWLPMYHDMGLIGGIMQPMYVGGPNTLISPMAFLQKPYRWLDIISRRRITHSGGPNFAYELCTRKITSEQRAKLDLSSWDLAFTGAEPIRAETIDQFCETFGPCGFRREAFFPCYGMAEATLMVSGGIKRNPPVMLTVDGDALDAHQVVEAELEEDSARVVVGCGGNLPDQEIVIVDPDTCRPLPQENVGEIWVAGPSIAKGYWRNPELTKKAFEARLDGSGRGPFLRTGDLGFLWEGELYVTGRLKDLIIVRGVNRYPQDIEATVQASHAWLRTDAGAVVVAEVAGQERLIVVNEVNRARGKSFDEVFAAIRREVAAEHELPVDAIALVRARTIPKTSSGKIQRHACAKDYVDGKLPMLAHWCAWEAPAPKPPRAAPASSAATPTQVATGPSPETTLAEPKAADDTATEPELNQQIADDVIAHVKEVGKERARDCTLDSNIIELGLDSLERMSVAANLEETYGGRFPNEVLHTLHTLRDVVFAVEKYLGDEPAPQPAAPAAAVPSGVLGQYGDHPAMPGYRRLKEELSRLAAGGEADPCFHVQERVDGVTTKIDGREVVDFSSCDYLGMSADAAVVQAASDAINRFGTNVSASRYASGQTPLHRDLEQALATFFEVGDSIVCAGEHAAHESTIGHLMRPGDLVLHDRLAHDSTVRGATASGAERREFPHNDWAALNKILGDLRGDYRRVLIALEGIYARDGDLPDLPRFVEVKNTHGALLLVDETHSAGTLGPRGRGLREHFDLETSAIDIRTGSLGASFGSCGSYVAGPAELIEYLKHTAAEFVAGTGLSPPSVAAALSALRLLEQSPERVAQCQARGRLFRELASRNGLNIGASENAPVVPIIVGNSFHALTLSGRLLERGFYGPPLVYPMADDAAARLRFFVTALHTKQQIEAAVEALTGECREIDPSYAAGAQAAVQADVAVDESRPKPVSSVE